MIRARRLLEPARRSQQLVLTNGGGAAKSSSSAINSFAALAPPPSRFRHMLVDTNTSMRLHGSSIVSAASQQRRWQSSISDSASSALSPAASDEIRVFMDELRSCRDAGNWRQALKLLDRIDKHGFPLDPHMYELTIAACARMGKVEVLPGLLQNMQVDAILPTTSTVDYIVQAYLAREEWQLVVDHALAVTTQGVALSDAAFHATMEACGQTRDAKSAKRVCTLATKTCNMALGPSHFAAAIRAVGMAGRPDIAVHLFTAMEQTLNVAADESVFNQLIRAQIVNHELPQALQTFATVNDRGLMLHEPIYTATIDALIKHGDYWHAGRLFDQMLAHGMHPSVFCYGRIMVAYVRTGKNSVAAACWQKIVDANEPAPALMKYTRLLQELAATSDSKLTLAVFDYIYRTFDPRAIRDATFALAIRANGRLGRTQAAVDLFDSFVASRRAADKPLPRSAGIYLSVFNALSRDADRVPAQNTDDAKRVWDLMTHYVPVILPPAYASLAGVFAASGELETLDELLAHANQSFADRSRLDEADDDADAAAALSTLDTDDDDDDSLDDALAAHVDAVNDVDDASDLHDELLFNGVISGFSKARDDQSHHIASYLERMKTRGLTINDSIVRASTDAFVRHHNWQRMNELVDYVDVSALSNADLCFGDTISKLLDAQAYDAARHWIAAAHRKGVQPPIRGKMEVLRTLRESQSNEWRIAYALALETLSFKHMVDVNVESVADAVDVCMVAGRSDLALKLYDRLASHNSLRERRPSKTSAASRPTTASDSTVRIPLRMYKQIVLALLREHAADPAAFERTIRKAERVCAQMLQLYRTSLDGDALSMAISIKATVGDDDDVMALYDTTQTLGLAPNSYAMNAAVVAFSRARQVDKVLAIRDALIAQCQTDPTFVPDPNVVKSLLFSLAIARRDTDLHDAIATIPGCSTENAVAALLQANRVDHAVELFDATVSPALFAALLKRICDVKPGHREHDPLTAAALLLKYVRFHGLESVVTPPSRVLKVTKALVAYGHLAEAGHILGLFADPHGDVLLKDMKPFFQQEVLEQLLFIYGETQQLEPLAALFARPILAFPLSVRHYEVAMEYASRTRGLTLNSSPSTKSKSKSAAPKTAAAAERATAGAVQCLKLFESMRQQFVKPNGAVYYSALRSCDKLALMDATGKRVLDDALAQGFGAIVTAELVAQATRAFAERKDAVPAAPARRGAPRKLQEPNVGTPTVSELHVDVAELARVTLFCHRNGLEVTPKLAKKLHALHAHLPPTAANELAFIAQVLEAEASVSSSVTTGAEVIGSSSSSSSSKRQPRAAAAAAAGAGARWGATNNLYLHPLDDDSEQ